MAGAEDPGDLGDVANLEAVRAFLAIELGAALRDQAAAVAAELRERERRLLAGHAGRPGVALRWTRAEGWHVTLRFLGATPPARIGEITERLRTTLRSAAPFELRLGAAGVFPERRPRVLALDLVPHAPIAALAGACEDAAVACGFAREARAFRPHLTLARARRGERIRTDLCADVRGLAASAAEMDGASQHVQQVREVVLFRSELRPDGARYSPLQRIALGGGDHP